MPNPSLSLNNLRFYFDVEIEQLQDGQIRSHHPLQRSILDDPFYLGLKQRRVNDKTQEEFMEEFMTEITLKYPKIVVQFEDFNSVNAFKWLERFRHRYSCFNDDIQGTGAVILAGFIKAVKLSGIPADKHRIVFHGAGSAGVLLY
jgi:malate dehydrogenase (oxaloacetate-decarboxylating)(NADP+)